MMTGDSKTDTPQLKGWNKREVKEGGGIWEDLSPVLPLVRMSKFQHMYFKNAPLGGNRQQINWRFQTSEDKLTDQSGQLYHEGRLYLPLLYWGW